jgi:glycosyltransferase involved in cell wall biosynthesis
MDIAKIICQKGLPGGDDMRVALLSKFFLPETGGIETHVYELADSLAKEGHKVFLITTYENYLKLKKRKFRFRILDVKSPIDNILHKKPIAQSRIGGLKAFNSEEAFIIAEKLKEVGIDIIHAHDPFSCYTSIFVKYMINKPVILTIHTSHGVLVNNDCYKGMCEGYSERRCIGCKQEGFYKAEPIYRIFDMRMRRLFLSNADKIICVSRKDKEDLVKYQGLKNNVVHINNWVCLEKYKIDARNKIRRKFNFSQEDKIILCVGRIVPQKGIEYLIKAIPFVSKHYPGCKVILTGRIKQKWMPSSYGELVENLIKKLDLENNIVFTGEIPKEEMPAIYKLADVMAFPTLHENYGLVNLEAMASGIPVVTTQLSVIREYIINGKNGLLVPPRDHKALAQTIIRLLGDNQLRNRLIKNGYETVRKDFNPKKQVEKIIKVYKEVIKNSQVKR